MTRLERIAQKGDRVIAERQTNVAVVLHHLLTGGHGRQGQPRFSDLWRRRAIVLDDGEQRQWIVAKRLDSP